MAKQPKHDTLVTTCSGRANQLPYAASRLGPTIDLVDMAKEISQADTLLNTRVSAKLKVITDQIRHLQQEAREILEQTRRDQQLHHAECNFKRIPGKTYHLYQKSNAQQYFSMLSPDDWGNQPPHSYLGAYRLENDMSWTVLDGDISKTDNSREIIERLLNNPID